MPDHCGQRREVPQRVAPLLSAAPSARSGAKYNPELARSPAMYPRSGKIASSACRCGVVRPICSRGTSVYATRRRESHTAGNSRPRAHHPGEAHHLAASVLRYRQPFGAAHERGDREQAHLQPCPVLAMHGHDHLGHPKTPFAAQKLGDQRAWMDMRAALDDDPKSGRKLRLAVHRGLG